MKGLTPKNIAAACHGILHYSGDLPEIEIQSVTTDSRKVEKDCLFIPIRGARVDGHDFISQVMAAGAMLTLSEQPLADNIPHIRVASTVQALKDLAEYYLQVLGIPVVGITGSVGKTSTKEMIAAVLAEKFSVLKTAGNFNNEIGLPLTVFRLRDEHQVAVLEMGISEFGEMSRLGKIAKPDVMVITNIGLCHLENLHSRDGILQAKTEVFAEMSLQATVILNGDDDKLSTISEVNGKAPVFFGRKSEKAAVYAENIENLGLKGTKCTIVMAGKRAEMMIPIPGKHMVMNALAAAAVGGAFGMELAEIATGISHVESVSGRLNIIETEQYTVVDDCYNANPISMKASLKLLADAGEGAVGKTAILGDMFELGANEKQLHREVGAFAATCGFARLIFVGVLGAEMKAAADENGADADTYYFATVEECIGALDEILTPRSTILVKASHGMGFARIVDKLTKKTM